MNHTPGFRLSPVSLLQVACLFGTSGPLQASPTGGEVTAGAVNIIGAGGTTTIHQSSDRAIIHWRDFSIGAGESVNFIMPSAGSAVLNRVTGSSVSTLDGHLASNGQVYLINPNGIVIGSSGVVATQGFVAGTGAVLDGEFLEGRRMTFSGATGRVVNSGTIDAGQGNVVLMAREIDQKGSITAGGSVALGAGTEVTLTREGDGGMSVRVSGEGKIDQSGTIEAARAELRAAGGNPYSLAINHDGVTRATGAVKSGGKVVLTGGKGGVRIGGKVQASGGKVDITGKRVELAATAEVDVSGEKGGGTIRVGGGFGGKAPELDNAEEVEVHEGARLAADALESGDGGRIAVWSDHSTDFRGGLSVRGAGPSGAGGFAEVSSAGLLDFTGTALLGGSGGMNGTLMLDPTDLTIGAAQAGSIVSSLASGNVVVATSGSGAGAGNLTISSAISYTSANDLFFLAHGSIRVNATVRNAGTGDITAIAGWDGTTGADGSVSGAGFLANAGSYGNNSGSIFIGGSTQTTATSLGSKDGDLFLGGSNLTVSGGNTANAFSQIGWNAVDQGAAHVVTGDIVLALKGALALQAGSANRTNAQLGHGGATSGDSTSTVDGTFSGNISATVAGATTLSASAAATAYAQIGHGGLASLGGKSGSISLQTGSLSAISGESFASYTAIGHGGTTSDSPAYSGDITVQSAGNITLTSGTSQVTSARIGHGGLTTTGASGRIEVTALDLLMNMKTGGQAISQIGHGGSNSRGTYDGDVEVTVRDITMDTTGQTTLALIGHGGGLSGVLSGNVTVRARDVSMFVTGNNGGAMQIGHLTGSGSMTGTTTLIARDISMRAGGTGAVPRVGMGASGGSSANATGNIVINGRNLTMVGGNSFTSFARVGHGGNLDGTVQGDINITINGESSLAAGSRAVPIIGHSTTSSLSIPKSDISLTTGTLDDSTSATATSVTLRTHVLQVFQEAGQFGNVTVTATGLNGNDGLLVLDEASTGFSPYTMTFGSTRDLTVNQPVTFQPTWVGNIRLLFGQNAGGTLRLNAAVNTPGSGTASITGGLFDDTVILGSSGTVDGTIDGGGGVNTLTGDANANAFVINGSNSGTLAGKTSGWLNFSNLSGEGGNDSFTFTNTGSLNGSITGGAGSNTLTGDADGDEFVVTGANSGSLTGKTGAWSGIQTLNGAAGVDRFRFVSGGGVGVVNGMGGSDFLQLSDTGGLATITGINSGTYLPITGGWSNIENLTGGLGADVFSFTNTGRLDGVIIGGGGTDLLRGDSDGNQFSISSAEGGTLDGKLSGWSGISSLEGGAGNDSFSFTNTGSLTGSIIGGAGSNTLTGDADGNHFVISGSNSGMMDGKVSAWSGIQTLNGGAGSDRFRFATGGSIGVINGMGGGDFLHLSDTGGQATITGINSGTYLPIASGWSNIEHLAGGLDADIFAFTNTGRIDGGITGGGGSDLLRGDDDGNRFAITSANAGTLEGKLSSWREIASLEGGTGNDTLTGTLSRDEFVISGSNSGSVTGLLSSWSGMENLAGSDGDDTFRFAGIGALTGSITGGQGRNEVIAPDSGGVFILNDSNTGRLVDRVGFQWTGIQDLTGGSGDDLFQFFVIASISGRVDGGGGNNTLQGDNGGRTFTITGTNSGTLGGKLQGWSNISNLIGGNGVDRFHFDGGSLVGGSIVGGAGINFLEVFGSTGLLYLLNGGDEGSIPGLLDSWAEIGKLTAGDGNDRFEFGAAGPFARSLDGGAGFDTMAATVPTHFQITGDQGHVADWQGTWEGIEGLEGSAGDDLFEVSGPVGLISGMGGDDTLKNYSGPGEFLIDGAGSGSLGAALWQGIENLTGSSGRDVFRFIGAGRIDGLLDGKGGINQLDYSEADSSVDVDLVAGTATRTGGIAGIAEVIGSAFADLLRGGPLASLLDGGAGDDVFVVRSGDQDRAAMTVIGGGGSDQLTLDFSDSLLDSTMRMMDGTLSRQWALGNEEYSFEGISLVRLIAGAGSDRVETAGFAFAQDLDGGGGTNTLMLDGRGQGIVDPTSPVAIGDSGLITHINFGTVDVINATTPDEVRAIIAASSSSFDLAERADLLRFLWFLESTVQAERRGGFRYIDSDGKPLDVMADSFIDR